ncbi:DUF1353 domain-containing protein [Roseicyclus amphidinii]|uniref:DUF1353 domain-containing protein n=1 Tax=Roseicyclus amphidinii TaxID=3034232 RepID=UPI0024E15C57|nr:DUF1353 domain-containing protein [Roseicyclus sp. Amp-Y-6]
MTPAGDVLFAPGLRRRWRSTQPLVWEVGRKGGTGLRVTIPAGTEFESSVPWWARWWIDPDDPRYLLAALVHDYLLEAGVYGRAQAAAEWYDGALAGGAPGWQARSAFVAVAAWAVYGGRG